MDNSLVEEGAQSENMAEVETDAEAMTRKTILNLIYTNDVNALFEMQVQEYDLNWLEAHPKTDLDE